MYQGSAKWLTDYDPCNIQYLSGPPVLYNGIITFILAACSNIELSSALTRWMANILEQYKVAANWRGLLMWSPFICINEVSTLTRCVCVTVWLCEVGIYLSTYFSV